MSSRSSKYALIGSIWLTKPLSHIFCKTKTCWEWTCPRLLIDIAYERNRACPWQVLSSLDSERRACLARRAAATLNKRLHKKIAIQAAADAELQRSFVILYAAPICYLLTFFASQRRPSERHGGDADDAARFHAFRFHAAGFHIAALFYAAAFL